MNNKKHDEFTMSDHLNKMIDDFWKAVIVYDILTDTTNCFSQFSQTYTEKEQNQLAIQHSKEVDDLILSVLRCPDSEIRKSLITSQTTLMRALLVHRCNAVVQTIKQLDKAGLVGFNCPEFTSMTYFLLVLTRAPHNQVNVPAAIPDKEVSL